MSEVLLTGLKIGESARWHDGRLWLANWRMQDGFEDNIKRLLTGPDTGQVRTARAPATHAGRP
jgi:hypothetical protein